MHNFQLLILLLTFIKLECLENRPIDWRTGSTGDVLRARNAFLEIFRAFITLLKNSFKVSETF